MRDYSSGRELAERLRPGQGGMYIHEYPEHDEMIDIQVIVLEEGLRERARQREQGARCTRSPTWNVGAFKTQRALLTRMHIIKLGRVCCVCPVQALTRGASSSPDVQHIIKIYRV